MRYLFNFLQGGMVYCAFHLGDVVSGVAGGLAASAVWAAVIWYYNRHRNKKLEREICESMKPEGVSLHADGSVGLCVKNPTLHPVVIRSVVLRGGTESQNTIGLSLHEPSSSKGTHAGERGWVELPPHTEAIWAFNFENLPYPAGALLNSLPLKSIAITLQYRTFLGTTKIVEIQPAESHQTYMLETFERAMTRNPPANPASS